jgi:hypothetical protein
VLGWEVEETEQWLEIVAKLFGGLRPLGVELVVEGLVASRACSRSSASLTSASIFFASGWMDLGRATRMFATLCTPLLFGLGEHVSKGCPEPERAVSDRDHQCPHVAVAQVS